MPECVQAIEALRICHRIVQVRDSATDHDDGLVLIALDEMPGQFAGSRRRPDAGGLDEHG